MYKDLIKKGKPDFDKAVEHFHHELSTLRTGRANSALVENVQVEVYGTKNPLKNIASITIPEAKSILIQPWDKSNLSEIEKAITNANLGLQPTNDGNNIRINLPPLTEERRKDLVKSLKQSAEECRVKIRNVREDIWKEVGKLQKDKKITEDEKYEAQEELKKVVDEYNEKVKELADKKEQEIMTV